VLDQEGVGELVIMGIKKGRATRKQLKIGICGEHGGEPKTIDFCHRVGMNYVSCSHTACRLHGWQQHRQLSGRRGK